VSTVLERGELFFFYRPRVGVTAAVDRLEDVQRFFLVLKPERRRVYRRLIVGPKRLPDPRLHERFWAFVAEVARSPAGLRDEIEGKTYETRTRGIRVQPGARAVGEARYAIVDHDGHTHLAYVLELPRSPGEAQRLFNVGRETSYVVAVRNPEAPAPPGAGLQPHRRAQYPPELSELFRGRRFIPAEPPELLDYEGAELVVIGASEDAEGELGIELDPKHERIAEAAMFRALRIRPGEVPVAPLAEGRLQ
jgi:hypothetical protein